MPAAPPAERLMRALSLLSPQLQPSPLRTEIPSGLSLGTARLLGELSTLAAQPAVGDLSKRLRLPLPRISKLLGELEDLGLIERTRHAKDRRRVEVRLLPAGHRAVEGFRSAHRQRLEHLIDVLGPRDTEQLLRIFEQAAARLSSQEPELRLKTDQEATP